MNLSQNPGTDDLHKDTPVNDSDKESKTFLLVTILMDSNYFD